MTKKENKKYVLFLSRYCEKVKLFRTYKAVTHFIYEYKNDIRTFEDFQMNRKHITRIFAGLLTMAKKLNKIKLYEDRNYIWKVTKLTTPFLKRFANKGLTTNEKEIFNYRNKINYLKYETDTIFGSTNHMYFLEEYIEGLTVSVHKHTNENLTRLWNEGVTK